MRQSLFPKISTALAACLLLFALAATAVFAAGDPQVTEIRPVGGNDGTLVVTVYDTDPADTVGDGSKRTIEGKALPGVGLRALRVGSVVQLTTEGTAQVAYGLDTGSRGYELLGLASQPPLATAGTTAYFAPETVQTALTNASQADLESWLIQPDSQALLQTTNDQGVAQFANLPYGLYLLTKSTLPADSTTDLVPFLAAVPMYVDDAWTATVYAYPKVRTQTLTITKSTTSDPYVNAGETIPFTITVTIPAGGQRTFNKFVITDTATGLSLPAEDATVMLGNQSLAPTQTPGQGTLTITLSAEDLKKLNDGLTADQTLTVSYNARVNTGVATFQKQLTNTAQLTYNRGTAADSADATLDASPVALYTYGIGLTKVLSDHAAIQKNTITFALYRNNNGGTLSDPVLLQQGSQGGYWVAPTGTSDMYVNENGTLNLYGLEPGTYYLQETATQTGYTKLAQPVAIVITEPTNPATDPTATVDGAAATVTDGVVQLQVTNTKTILGFALPKTGGEGTLLVTALGLGLLAAAVVLLALYRKKQGR